MKAFRKLTYLFIMPSRKYPTLVGFHIDSIATYSGYNNMGHTGGQCTFAIGFKS